jgi:hypothetical protein
MLLHRPRSAHILLCCLGLLTTHTALAKPPGIVTFCATYPQSPLCGSGQTVCGTCHVSAPTLNVFGTTIKGVLAVGAQRPLTDAAFSSALPTALRAVEPIDSDGDGATNGDEIRSGFDPANSQSKPSVEPCDADNAAKSDWNVCVYDVNYTFRKVMADFCGRSASFEEREKFRITANPKQALHQALDGCLTSEYWQGRDGVVWNLASPKIRPIQSIKGGVGAGPIPLADYFYDYALFVYAQTGDRDARDLLQAQYLVEASETVPTTYRRFDQMPFNVYETGSMLETIPREQRAGMISSRWFRTINTMFTSVPRTTAAQAYRAYLGLDIALLQGLQNGAPGEPVDYDKKGVRAAECSTCHQTLDPLSYPFSRYEGIDSDDKTFSSPAFYTSYRTDRMERFAPLEGPLLLSVPEAGLVLGKPVKNLVEWAGVAAQSDEFAQKTVRDYWRVLFGAEPLPSETPAFTKLWKKFRTENQYQVKKTLHDLIETEAYGVP